MGISRRNLLKMAAASAALSGQPMGSALGAVSGAAEATGSGALFAVVSPGKAWAVCSSYHEAYHHAGIIRHSGGVCTSHVRCTPAFAEQVRAGTLNSFVEIDGWAVTSNEAEARSLDFLRNAMDRAATRRQLMAHYGKVAIARVDAHDRKAAGTCRYVTARFDDGRPAQIVSAAVDEDTALLSANRRLSGTPDDEPLLDVHLCTPDLHDQLCGWLNEGGSHPEIVAGCNLHMTQTDYSERLEADPLFRFAMLGITSHTVPDASPAQFVAYDRQDNWIYGAGDDEDAAYASAGWAVGYTDGRELLITRASLKLAARVHAQGLEFPAFWKRVGSIARHESELLTPQTARPGRRGIRPPVPEWKRR